jgi:aminoglycoside phosphotransferase (APT) family kinase protein
MASHPMESVAAERGTVRPRGLSLVPPSPEADLLELLARFEHAHKRRLWDEMRECFHDEARIESVAAGGVLGPAETVDAVRAAFDEGIYSMSDWELEQLGDPDAALAWAGVRHRPAGSPARISDATIYWLVTGRDGLVWRVRIFRDRSSALSHLARTGHSLGL